MDSVQRTIDGKVLSQILALPKSLQNIRVSVTVTPAEEEKIPKIKRSELLAKLPGSKTEALTGILDPETDMTLDEIRAERRMRYERPD